MNFLRNLGKIVKAGVIAYVAGGIAYWITAEVFLRYIGNEITFSPLVSVLLVVPFWSMLVYADLRWIGVLPQDIAAILVISVSVSLLLSAKIRRMVQTALYKITGKSQSMAEP